MSSTGRLASRTHTHPAGTHGPAPPTHQPHLPDILCMSNALLFEDRWARGGHVKSHVIILACGELSQEVPPTPAGTESDDDRRAVPTHAWTKGAPHCPLLPKVWSQVLAPCDLLETLTSTRSASSAGGCPPQALCLRHLGHVGWIMDLGATTWFARHATPRHTAPSPPSLPAPPSPAPRHTCLDSQRATPQ